MICSDDAFFLKEIVQVLNPDLAELFKGKCTPGLFTGTFFQLENVAQASFQHRSQGIPFLTFTWLSTEISFFTKLHN